MPTINTPGDQARNGVPGGLDSNAILNGRNARADPVQDFEAAANALIARRKLGVPSIAIPISGQDLTFEMYATNPHGYALLTLSRNISPWT